MVWDASGTLSRSIKVVYLATHQIDPKLWGIHIWDSHNVLYKTGRCFSYCLGHFAKKNQIGGNCLNSFKVLSVENNLTLEA